MSRPPVILISACVEREGFEMTDQSVSLSEAYLRALMAEGALPLILPCATSAELLAAAVSGCDGVMLTGGDDISPDLYDPELPAPVRKKVKVEHAERDLRELLLLEAVFAQRKPLLAICRGHQMLNVAFGGTLVADIPSQRSSRVRHRRMDAKRELVHEIELAADCLLARLAGGPRLGVNSTHHQAVDRVGGPLRAVGHAPDGLIEALELKPEARDALPFLLSVQFHPERLVDQHPQHRAIFTAFVGACAAASRRGRRGAAR